MEKGQSSSISLPSARGDDKNDVFSLGERFQNTLLIAVRYKHGTLFPSLEKIHIELCRIVGTSFRQSIAFREPPNVRYHALPELCWFEYLTIGTPAANPVLSFERVGDLHGELAAVACQYKLLRGVPERFFDAWRDILAEAETDGDEVFVAGTVHNAPGAFEEVRAVEAVMDSKRLVGQLGPFDAFEFEGAQFGCYIAHTDGIDGAADAGGFEQVWGEMAVELLFVGRSITQANLVMRGPTHGQSFKDVGAIGLVVLSLLCHFDQNMLVRVEGLRKRFNELDQASDDEAVAFVMDLGQEAARDVERSCFAKIEVNLELWNAAIFHQCPFLPLFVKRETTSST